MSRCTHCGALTMKYRFSLSTEIVEMLRALRDAGGEADLRALGLSNSAYSNVNRVRHWGFVESIRRGTYRLTGYGRLFLSGEIPAPEYIWTYRNRVVGYEGDYIFVNDVTASGGSLKSEPMELPA